MTPATPHEQAIQAGAAGQRLESTGDGRHSVARKPERASAATNNTPASADHDSSETTLLEKLRIGPHDIEISATDIWTILRARILDQGVDAAVEALVRAATPRYWRQDHVPGGDVELILVVHIPSGVPHATTTTFAHHVRDALDHFWPGYLGVLIEEIHTDEETQP
jgi:hypothetical protein